MNTQFNPMQTQPMPTRDAANRMAEAMATWAAGKIADYNARRSLERGGHRVQGWTIIES